MHGKQPYDVVLDDQLQWTYVPQLSNEGKAAIAEEDAARRFLERWTEKGGIQKNDLRGPPGTNRSGIDGGFDDEVADEGDDIGARFENRGRQLANANRDISRMLDKTRLLFAKTDNPPDIATGHKLVLMDRARRIAFGYDKPAPMSLAQGFDGGVNTVVYRRRRQRPSGRSLATRRRDMLPKRHVATTTTCVGVLPNQFSVNRHRPTSKIRIARTKAENASRPSRRNRDSRLQRALAQYLLRQPAVTAVHAALRHI